MDKADAVAFIEHDSVFQISIFMQRKKRMKNWMNKRRNGRSNGQVKKRRKEKSIIRTQFKEMFPFYNLWSYIKARVPFASTSCSEVIIKCLTGKRRGLWGCGEAWRSQNCMLDLLSFESYMKSRVLLYCIQGEQQYLETKNHYFPMTDELVQICRLVP